MPLWNHGIIYMRQDDLQLSTWLLVKAAGGFRSLERNKSPTAEKVDTIVLHHYTLRRHFSLRFLEWWAWKRLHSRSQRGQNCCQLVLQLSLYLLHVSSVLLVDTFYPLVQSFQSLYNLWLLCENLKTNTSWLHSLFNHPQRIQATSVHQTTLIGCFLLATTTKTTQLFSSSSSRLH